MSIPHTLQHNNGIYNTKSVSNTQMNNLIQKYPLVHTPTLEYLSTLRKYDKYAFIVDYFNAFNAAHREVAETPLHDVDDLIDVINETREQLRRLVDDTYWELYDNSIMNPIDAQGAPGVSSPRMRA